MRTVAALALLVLAFVPVAAAAAAGQARPAAESAAVDSGGAPPAADAAVADSGGGPPAADSTDADFAPLLAHLPAASHAVLLVDVARLRAALDAFADRLATSPLFAGHPELAAALAAQRARAERQLAALGAAAGLDPLRDLQRAALGLVWADPQAPPGMLLVLAGRLPAGLAAALAGGAEPVARRAGVALYAPEPGLRAAMVDGLLLLGHPKQLDAALAADAARARALVERLAGLGAPRGAEFMLRLRVELPAWVNAAAAAPGQRPLDTLFGSWRRFGLELGAGFAMDAAAADAAGAERLEMVWRAWRELMLGGAYMWRAYALLLLGLDLSRLPGLPPFAQRALADRQALQQTLELVFPAPSGQVRVARQGRSVRLSAPPRMLQGALFVMGIGATIAIPLLLRQLDTAGPPSASGGHSRRKK